MTLRTHKAKKDHVCDACGNKIPKGDRYWRNYESDESGPISDHKEHSNCELYAVNCTASIDELNAKGGE